MVTNTTITITIMGITTTIIKVIIPTRAYILTTHITAIRVSTTHHC